MTKTKITFELARDLGLLPKMTKRYFGWFPFMSAYGVEKRDAEQNDAYESELKAIQLDYCDDKMLVEVELNSENFPTRAISRNTNQPARALGRGERIRFVR